MSSWQATLTLSGGGARGIAHLGAIEELLRAGLVAERIVGVSIGSLVGALYAFEPDIEHIQKKARDYLHSPEFAQHQKHLLGAHPASAEASTGGFRAGYERMAHYVRANQLLHRAVRRGALLPGRLLEAVVNHLLPEADITDAAIPLSIVAVDLNTGRPVVLDRGPVRLAVRASASVPGVFPPIPLNDQLLCDIGGFYSLPLSIARKYAPETLVAVDVDATLKPLSRSPTALEILIRMNDIAGAMFRQHLSEEADLTILPEVGDVHWFDFRTFDAMRESGRVAARAALSGFTPPQGWFQRLFTWRPGMETERQREIATQS